MNDEEKNRRWEESLALLGLTADPPPAPREAPTPRPEKAQAPPPPPKAAWKPREPDPAPVVEEPDPFPEIHEEDRSVLPPELLEERKKEASGGEPGGAETGEEKEERRGRRRRGRRGRRPNDREPVAGEAEPPAEGAGPEKEPTEDKPPHRGRRPVKDRPPKAVPSAARHEEPSLDDEPEDLTTGWNIPSWNELIDALHRP